MTILIFTLPAISVEGNLPPEGNPSLRDVSCDTLESAAASFTSNWALGQAPILIAISVLPAARPYLHQPIIIPSSSSHHHPTIVPSSSHHHRPHV